MTAWPTTVAEWFAHLDTLGHPSRVYVSRESYDLLKRLLPHAEGITVGDTTVCPRPDPR